MPDWKRFVLFLISSQWSGLLFSFYGCISELLLCLCYLCERLAALTLLVSGEEEEEEERENQTGSNINKQNRITKREAADRNPERFGHRCRDEGGWKTGGGACVEKELPIVNLSLTSPETVFTVFFNERSRGRPHPPPSPRSAAENTAVQETGRQRRRFESRSVKNVPSGPTWSVLKQATDGWTDTQTDRQTSALTSVSLSSPSD